MLPHHERDVVESQYELIARGPHRNGKKTFYDV